MSVFNSANTFTSCFDFDWLNACVAFDEMLRMSNGYYVYCVNDVTRLEAAM